MKLLWTLYWLLMAAIFACMAAVTCSAQLTVSGNVTVSGQVTLSGSAAVAPTTSNIQSVNAAQNLTSASNHNSITYTPASTSNRLWISPITTDPLTFTLSDTAGLAASANTPGPANIGGTGGSTVQNWNMGASASADTITQTIGGTNAIGFMLREYSGIGNTIDSFDSALGTSTSCSLTHLTASQAGELTVVHVSTANTISAMTATAGFSQGAVLTNGTTYANQYAETTWDNLNTPAGSVPFTAKFASSSGASNCWGATIPGLSAASPNYYPSIGNSDVECNSSTAATPFSVNTGDQVTVIVAQGGFSSMGAPSSITSGLGITYGAPIKSTQLNQGGFWQRQDWYAAVAGSTGTESITANGTLSNPCTAVIPVHGQSGTGTLTDSTAAGSTTGSLTLTEPVTNNKSFALACFGSWGATNFLPIPPPLRPAGVGIPQTESLQCVWSRRITSGSLSIPQTGLSTLAAYGVAGTFQ